MPKGNRWNLRWLMPVTLCAIGLFSACDLRMSTVAPLAVEEIKTEEIGRYVTEDESALSVRQLQVLKRVRQDETPVGVQIASTQWTKERPSASFESVMSAPPIASIQSEDCFYNEEDEGDCMRSWLDAFAAPSSIEYAGGAYMYYGTNAQIAVGAFGWITREGYPMGLDDFPLLKTKIARKQVEQADIWGGTCSDGRYNAIIGFQKTFAEYVTLLPPVGMWWVPKLLSIDSKCNPEAKGQVTEDMCGGEPELRAPDDRASLRNLYEECDPNGEGGGGGGTEILRCGWYTYEISFDGGLTWYPYGEPFLICEPMQQASVQDFDVDNLLLANSQNVDNLTSGDPVAKRESRQNAKIIGRGQMRDAARAFVYRDMMVGDITIAVDTSATTSKDLEAAFLGVSDILKFRPNDSRITHVRMQVGDHKLSQNTYTRTMQRNRQYLQALRSTQERPIAAVGKGRTLDIVIDVPAVVRKTVP